MRFRVLGPLAVTRDGAELNLGGPKPRLLLAMLIKAGGTAVSTDTLVDGLWREALPANPKASLQVHVHNLRGVVGGVLRTEPQGYSLETNGAVDAVRFEQLHHEGQQLLGADPARAANLLREALSLRRGPPYADLADEPALRGEVARLEGLCLAAVGDRIDADLTLGAHVTLTAELEGLVHDHPLHERFRAQHMLALYRSGRQGEALRAYQAYRDLLADEMGLSPGEELVALDRAIATDDASLRVRRGAAAKGYEIHELIGVGAFAEIYRGVQPGLGREVAIKVIKGDLANRPEFIRGFEAEAATVARLEHPHIVPLYDFWREPDRAHLVMRWLQGGNLEQGLDAGPWPVRQVSQLVEQVGSALAHAHRHGVVHRDVKPANVLLDLEGNFYLGDFGIAVEARATADPRAVLSDGSPSHAPPEQLRRQPVGPAGDIYSLAVTVFETLTSRPPFPRTPGDEAALLRRALSDPIADLSALRPDLPGEVGAVLAKATAKNPDDRYQRVDDFVMAFAGALASGTDAPPAVRETAGRATALAVTVENPYNGLHPFREVDADRFFGRERLVDEMVDHLTGNRVLVAVGASGSGKSSVVAAGLLPAIRRGRVPGSSSWFVTTMTPGIEPFEALETALLRIAVNPPTSLLDQLRADRRGVLRGVRRIVPTDETTVVLVIDQFEELFTLCDDGPTRSLFLDGLVTALTEPSSPLRLVSTLRADFYDHPLRHPGFAALLKRHAVTITPLAADELEQAIVEPARWAGVDFEPGLVAEVVADVASQAGALPLMQYALTEVFEQRSASCLTLDAYRAMGGVSGAVAQRAEATYGDLAPADQAAARRMFGRLVRLGEGAEDTRRRMLVAHLGDDAATAGVLERFGAARLVSFDRDAWTRQPTVEIAHEALLDEWPRLHGWLEEDRAGRHIEQHLGRVADEWARSGRPESELYRGGRLETALEWADANPEAPTPTEHDFLDAARQQADTERRRERRRITRLRVLVTATGIALILALVAGMVANSQRTDAEAARDLARSAEDEARRGELVAVAAARANTDEDPSLGLLLAAEAHARDPGPDSLGALQRALTRDDGFLGYLKTPDGYMPESLAFASADRLVARAATSIDTWDIRTAQMTASITVGEGRRLQVVDKNAYTIAHGNLLQVSLDDTKIVTLDSTGTVNAFAVSPDRSILAIADHDGGLELRSGTEWQHSRHLEPENQAIEHLAFSPSGQLMLAALAGGNLIQWNIEGGPDGARRVGPLWADSDRPADFEPGPDGARRVGPLWADSDRPADFEPAVLRIPRAGDQQLVPHQLEPHDFLTIDSTWLETDEGAAFVDVLVDGGLRNVAVVGGGRVLVEKTIYQLSTWATQSELRAATGTMVAVGVHEDQILAVATDENVSLWSLDGRNLLARALPRQLSQQLVSLDPTGQRLIASPGVPGVVVLPGAVSLWNVETGDQPRPPPEDPSAPPSQRAARSAFWDSSGNLWTTHGNYVRLVDRGFGVSAFTGARVTSSPDGRLVAVGGYSVVIKTVSDGGHFDGYHDVDHSLTDLAEASEARTDSSFSRWVHDLRFSWDSSMLAAISIAGAVVVWDTETWEPIAEILPSDPEVRYSMIGFSRHGELFAAAETAGRIHLYDPETWQPIGVPIEGAPTSFGSWAPGRGLWFSQDDRFLLVAGSTSAQLVDVEERKPIGAPLSSSLTSSTAASADGAWVAIPVADHILVFNAEPDTWPSIACRAAGRTLTQQEWTTHIGNEPYDPYCT